MMHSQLNWARVAEKVGDIKRSLAQLRRQGERIDEEFLTDENAVLAARYTFIVLVEAATNIAAHIATRQLHEAPTSYADSFFLMADNGLLDEELADRLGEMCGFRNLLVHGYDRIDDTRMLAIIREDLGDLELFLDAVTRLRN